MLERKHHALGAVAPRVRTLLPNLRRGRMDTDHERFVVNRRMDMVPFVWSSLRSIVEGPTPGREHGRLVGHVAAGFA